MSASAICDALQRVEATFTEKPAAAVQPDAPARAVLAGGLAMVVHHPKGHMLKTDMPRPLGGGGAEVTPGWLMRAGLASCTATVIALRAGRLGIALSQLEVTVESVSDARGMLGLDSSTPAGPLQMDMRIQVAADGVDEKTLAELVAWADEHSPVGNVVRRPMDVRLSVNGSQPALH